MAGSIDDDPFSWTVETTVLSVGAVTNQDESIAAALQRHHVDGRTLLKLSSYDVLKNELGIVPLGLREKIMSLVEYLRKHSPEYSAYDAAHRPAPEPSAHHHVTAPAAPASAFAAPMSMPPHIPPLVQMQPALVAPPTAASSRTEARAEAIVPGGFTAVPRRESYGGEPGVARGSSDATTTPVRHRTGKESHSQKKARMRAERRYGSAAAIKPEPSPSGSGDTEEGVPGARGGGTKRKRSEAELNGGSSSSAPNGHLTPPASRPMDAALAASATRDSTVEAESVAPSKGERILINPHRAPDEKEIYLHEVYNNAFTGEDVEALRFLWRYLVQPEERKKVLVAETDPVEAYRKVEKYLITLLYTAGLAGQSPDRAISSQLPPRIRRPLRVLLLKETYGHRSASSWAAMFPRWLPPTNMASLSRSAFSQWSVNSTPGNEFEPWAAPAHDADLSATGSIYSITDEIKPFSSTYDTLLQWEAGGGVLVMTYPAFRRYFNKNIPTLKKPDHRRAKEIVLEAASIVIADEASQFSCLGPKLLSLEGGFKARTRIITGHGPSHHGKDDFWDKIDEVLPGFLEQPEDMICTSIIPLAERGKIYDWRVARRPWSDIFWTDVQTLGARLGRDHRDSKTPTVPRPTTAALPSNAASAPPPLPSEHSSSKSAERTESERLQSGAEVEKRTEEPSEDENEEPERPPGPPAHEEARHPEPPRPMQVDGEQEGQPEPEPVIDEARADELAAAVVRQAVEAASARQQAEAQQEAAAQAPGLAAITPHAPAPGPAPVPASPHLPAPRTSEPAPAEDAEMRDADAEVDGEADRESESVRPATEEGRASHD